KRDLYTCLERAAEGVLFDLQSRRYLRLSACALSPPPGVVLGDIRRRYEPDALGDHRLHVFRRDVVAVFDRVHTGFHGVVHTQQRRGMRRHTVALTVSLVNNGAELIGGKRWNRVDDIVMNPATTVGIDLDPIDAVRKLLPHCLARTFDAI